MENNAAPDHGQRDELIRWRRFVELVPNDPDVRLGLARRLLKAHQTEEAVAETRRVLSMAPNHLDAWKLLEETLAFEPSKRSPS